MSGISSGASRLLVVGDVIDDIVAIPAGPILPDTDAHAAILRSPGGSGANTAAWLGFSGCAVDFVGAVGPDGLEAHSRALRNAGVTPHLVVVPTAPTGTIVIVVDGEQRTMLTERGANAMLRSVDVSDELLASAAVLYVSGYSVTGAFGAAGAVELMARAHRVGVRVALGSGSTGFLRELGVETFRSVFPTVDLFLVNHSEGELLTGRTDPGEIVTELLGELPVVALTLGGGGALIGARGVTAVAVPVEAAELRDPTGAGDAFAAGFLSVWARSEDLQEAGRVGVALAARAVAQPGARPPVDDVPR